MKFKYLFTALILILSASASELLCQVVINELQPAPKNNEPEWIELYNKSDNLYTFSGCTIKDAATKKNLPDFVIPSNGYAVLTKDTTALKISRNISEKTILIEAKLPSLNNDSDELVLINNAGTVLDSIYYNMDWGTAGISLERIFPGEPAISSDNWLPCVNASGATPGDKNSRFKDNLSTGTSLSAIPNPFSPNGTGQYSNCTIYYKLPFSNATINADIFDYDGKKIKNLASNKTSGQEGFVIWDGRNVNAISLPVGPYIFLLEATDLQTGDKFTDKMMIVLGN